jgi:hypothetical protein
MDKSIAMAVFVVAGMGAAGAGLAALQRPDTPVELPNTTIETATPHVGAGPDGGPDGGDGGPDCGGLVTPLFPEAGVPATIFAVTGSSTTSGTVACNGPPASCPGGPPNVGAAWNTTIPRSPAYVLGGWQDVLEILYLGIVDTGLGHTGDPEAGQHCNSQIRQLLANNWGNFFEVGSSGCSGAPGDGTCTSAPCACTQLRHIYRPDDSSSVAQVFAQVLSSTVPNATITVPSATANPAPSTVGTYAIGSDQFCNDTGGAGGTAWPGSNTAVIPKAVVPYDHQDYDPIRRPCAGSGGLSKGTAANPNATEQVCERATANSSATATATASGGGVSAVTVTNPGSGYTAAPDVVIYGGRGTGATATATLNASGGVASVTVTNPGTGYTGGTAIPQVTIAQWQPRGSLGLVLPVISAETLTLTPHPESPNINYQYDINTTATLGGPACDTGGGITGLVNECNGPPIEVSWPTIPKPPGTGAGNNPGLCPNGDVSGALGNACFVPADSNGNPNCISYVGRDSTPAAATCSNNQGSPDGIACSTSGPAPNTVDVRTYNLYSYRFNSCTFSWSLNVDDSDRPVVGAFYRIHTSQDMLVPNQPGATVGTSVCGYQSMDNQIGCLVQASPCSIGLAAGTAAGVTGLTTCLSPNTALLLNDCPSSLQVSH